MAISLEAECALTHEGDVVCLIGSGDDLGRWDVQNAVQLQTGPELWPRWRAVLPLSASGAECKLIIKRRGGNVDWEAGDNRSFPSTRCPATVRMSYGRREMDLIPETQNGYPAEPKSSPDGSPSSQEMVLPRSGSGSFSRPKSRTDLRQRLMDLEFKKNIEERYDIEKTKIGEGGFGTVSRARDKATGVRRAVKMVMKAHVDLEQMRKEIEITQKLDHPNIVRLFAIYEDRCSLYLVMELCEGGELFDRLVEEKFLTEPIVRKVMKQVFSSLAYCHSKDVVHRDLKPENYILLSKDKAVDQTPLKLIDFGLANRCGEGFEELRSAVGTSYYVAPEVLKQKYGKAVDVWSCGVLMYCLHCGSPPFYGSTDIEILRRVKKGQYSMQGPSWSSVSSLAKDLIEKCLQMDPQKRLTAMGALKHPWFQVQDSTALLDSKVLANLRSFSVKNRFQKAAMTAVAYQLTPEEQAELRDVFTEVDANSDGYLSFQEIKKGLACKLNEDHIPNLSEILQSMDTNDDGKIEYTEFIAAAMDHRLQRNESLCWRAFKTFDKDDDGKITLDELKEVLKDELKQEVPSSRSASFYFNAMDADGNGEVSFEEFMDMLHSGTSRKPKSSQHLEELMTAIDEAKA